MKKILLIEDDPLLIDMYGTKFREAGFEILVVEHGHRAVEMVEQERPALVLLDIVLPRVDGWDILQELKAREDLQAIPVVVLSNLGQKEEIEKGLRLGATKYLIKAHYTPSEVVEEVAKLL